MNITIDMNISVSSLLGVLKEKKLIDDFFSDISEENILFLLYNINCDDAKYIECKPNRKEAYIKSKRKDLRNKINKDENIAELAMLFWLKEKIKKEGNAEKSEDINFKFSKQINHKYEKISEYEEEINETNDSGKDKEAFSLFDNLNYFYPLIRTSMEKDDIWRAYLLSAFLLFNMYIGVNNKETFEREFLDNFKNMNLSYLKEKLKEFVRNNFSPYIIEGSMNKIKEDFALVGEQLVVTGKEMVTRGIPPNRSLIFQLNSITSNFNRIRDIITNLSEFYDIKLDDKEINNLDKITEKLKPVLENYSRLEKEKKESAKVISLFKTALQITSKDSSNLDYFKEKISEELRLISQETTDKNGIDIRASVLCSSHPICHLIRLISEELDYDEIIDISRSVKDHYGEKIARLAIKEALYINSELEEKLIISSDNQVEDKKQKAILEIKKVEHIEERFISEENVPVVASKLSKLSNSLTPKVNGITTLAGDKEYIKDVIYKEKHGILPYSAETTSITDIARDIQKENIYEVKDSSLLSEEISQKVETIIEPQKAYIDEVTELPLHSEETSIKAEAIIVKPQKEEIEKELPNISLPIEEIPIEEQMDTAEIRMHYEWKEDNSTYSISKAILNNAIDDRLKGLNKLVWQSLLENKTSIAYQLNVCIESLYPDVQCKLPSWILRSVSTGKHVRYESDELANILKEDFAKFDETCFIAGNKEWNHSIRFLLISAALYPALLAPSTGAPAILKSLKSLKLKDSPTKLYEYCEIIADYGSALQALDINSLKKVKDQVAWKSEMNALQIRVTNWKKQALKFNIISTPGQKVWRHWLKTGELVYNLLAYISKNDPSQVDKAKKDLQKYSDPLLLKRLIHDTHREVLKITYGGNIVTRAQTQLLKHFSDVINFVQEWVDLQETYPERKKTYIQEQAEKLRENIFKLHEDVIKELNVFKKSYKSLFIHSSINCCKHTLEKIYNLFNPDIPVSKEENEVKFLLNVDFLKMSSFVLDENWLPISYNPEIIINEILKFLSNKGLNWKEAFEEHSEKRNHKTTKYIMEYLGKYKNEELDINLEKMSQLRDKYIKECQETLKLDIKDKKEDRGFCNRWSFN